MDDKTEAPESIFGELVDASEKIANSPVGGHPFWGGVAWWLSHTWATSNEYVNSLEARGNPRDVAVVLAGTESEYLMASGVATAILSEGLDNLLNPSAERLERFASQLQEKLSTLRRHGE